MNASRGDVKSRGVIITSLIFLLGTLAGLVVDDIYHYTKRQLVPPEPPKPVLINLQFDPAVWEAGNIFGGESYEWVFPRGRSLLSRPPKGPCYRRYGWSQGPAGAVGVDARMTRFRLTIQSSGEQSVLLEKVSPVIHRRAPSEEGTHVACPVGGASANLRRFAVDLDRGTGVFSDGEGNPLPTTMLKFGPRDSEPLLVIASAERARFDWSLRLDFIIDGESVPFFINDEDEGQLFSTTGVGRAQTVHWSGKRWLAGHGPLVGASTP